MCGRYTLTVDSEALQARFETTNTLQDLQPRYNIAPTQDLPVIIHTTSNVMVMMRWGLIPFWAQDASIGNRMINARAETVAEKPAFRRAFRSHRCLIPVSGFYEWQRTPSGKAPFFIHLKNRDVFACAGLYDTWQDSEGTTIQSYTIITTTPNQLVAPVHDRMPVIIPQSAESIWLDPNVSDPARLLSMLTPYPAEEMAAYRVASWINRPSNDSPQVLEPLGRVA